MRKKCITPLIWDKKTCGLALPKVPIVMKSLFYACLLSSAGLTYASNSYSQTTMVSINVENQTVKEVLDEIENTTEYSFFYNTRHVDLDRKVSVNINNADIFEVLDDVFSGTNVVYFVKDRSIILSVKDASPVITQNYNKITGTIVDASGIPVIGANVMVKGTTNGTITDLDGRFTLDVPKDAVLEVSYIGYSTQTVKVSGQKSLSIMLKEDTQALDEVVVVGYGTMKKSDVTGSVSVAKGDDILKTQSFSALDNLKGKVSGVNIYSNTGQPGGSTRVLIRGIGTIQASSNPLYIVDGVAMEDFKYLNPNDIERIEVLKDASSAAIYGARGANGVILVTTKRGLKGDGVSVNYSGSVSLGTMARYMDLLDSDEFMEAYKIGLENANRWYGKNYSTDLRDYFSDPRLFTPDGKPIYNTDWQRESTRNAISHNHQLSVQQGGKKSSVGAFVNYTDQQGLMLNNYMKRMNAKLTYDANPAKWLSIGVNLLVNHTWGNENEDTGGGSHVPRRTMIEMVPFMPVKFPDGSWSNPSTTTDQLGLETAPNPVHLMTTQQQLRYRTQIFGNMALTFHLLPGLDLKTQLGVDGHQNKNKNYSPKDLVNLSFPNGNASIGHYESLYWQEETYLNYNKTLGKHRLNAMAGLSWQQREYRKTEASASGFPDDLFGSDNLGAGTTQNPSVSGYDSWSMNSYFLRAAYSYNDKYMATFTGRVDGSSKFGDNNKYAFFPSVGLGWILSNESFMEGITNLDQLKLHTSFGITGNSEIGTYRSLATMSSGTSLIGGDRVLSSSVSRLANPDLSWEKSQQFDVGINLNLFKNRLNFDVSYYYKRTNDLLLDRPVPHTTGFNSVTANIGSVENQGVDFMLNAVVLENKEFNWTSTLNFNYNKNKILKLGENNEDILPGPNWVSGSQTILRVGEPLSSFYGYERLGIWTEDEVEEAKAVGANVGEAKRSKEKKILGCGLPDVTGSFINTFTYKNFDLTLDLQFSIGGEILQQFMHASEDRFALANGLSSILYDAWSPSNPNTMVQAIRIAPKTGLSSELDSHWVCNGSYLRGNLLQLGYTFDQSVLSTLKLKGLRIYGSVNNLFVIHSKDFKGYDPEGSSYGDDQWGQNMFFYQYPKPRTYTLGVNVTF